MQDDGWLVQVEVAAQRRQKGHDAGHEAKDEEGNLQHAAHPQRSTEHERVCGRGAGGGGSGEGGVGRRGRGERKGRRRTNTLPPVSYVGGTKMGTDSDGRNA